LTHKVSGREQVDECAVDNIILLSPQIFNPCQWFSRISWLALVAVLADGGFEFDTPAALVDLDRLN
jgi:hypothetical protein